MTRFLALYDGDSVPRAKLVAISCDPRIVLAFGHKLIHGNLDHETEGEDKEVAKAS